MKDIKNLSTIIAFPLIALLFWIVVGVFVLGRWWQDIEDKQEKIKSLENKVESMVPKLDLLNAQDVNDLEKYFIELNIAVPRRVVAPVILSSVENEIVGSGMALQNIYFSGINAKDKASEAMSSEDVIAQKGETNTSESNQVIFDTDIPSDGNGTISVNITASGEMYQILDAIKKLHNSLPLMRVTSIDITAAPTEAYSPEQEGEEAVHSPSKDLTLSLESPFEGLVNSIGAPSDPITGLSENDKKILEELVQYTSLYDQKTIDPQSQYQTGKNDPF